MGSWSIAKWFLHYAERFGVTQFIEFLVLRGAFSYKAERALSKSEVWSQKYEISDKTITSDFIFLTSRGHSVEYQNAPRNLKTASQLTKHLIVDLSNWPRLFLDKVNKAPFGNVPLRFKSLGAKILHL